MYYVDSVNWCVHCVLGKLVEDKDNRFGKSGAELRPSPAASQVSKLVNWSCKKSETQHSRIFLTLYIVYLFTCLWLIYTCLSKLWYDMQVYWEEILRKILLLQVFFALLVTVEQFITGV